MATETDYWAGRDTVSAVKETEERVRDYRKGLITSGQAGKMYRAVRILHGLAGGTFGPDASRLGKGGSTSQKAQVRFNEAGSIARSVANLVAQNTPALTVVPSNTDFNTVAQLKKTKRYFRYYFNQKLVPQRLASAVYWSLPYSVSYIGTDWDPFAGKELEQPDPLVPARTMTGDLRYGSYRPIDCAFDMGVEDDDHDWYVTRDVLSRWTLAANFPRAREAILRAPAANDEGGFPWQDFSPVRLADQQQRSDRIAVYTLLHRRNSAIKPGRLLRWVSTDDDGWLFDGGLPFPRVPITPIHSGRIANTPFYDSPFWQILGAQEVYDRLMSAVVTNSLALAHPLIVMYGTKFEVRELSDGVSAIVLPMAAAAQGAEPKSIDMMPSPTQVLELARDIKAGLQAVMGVLDLGSLRGPNTTSGAHAVFLVNMALQHVSNLQESFYTGAELVGNDSLANLKAFADKGVLMSIGGQRDGDYELVEFKAEDFEGIERLQVQIESPTLRTETGRRDFLELGLKYHLITNMNQAKQQLQGGDQDQLTEDGTSDMMRIERENEWIVTGKGPEPIVLWSNKHPQEMLSHSEALNQPGITPEAIARGKAHTDKHLSVWATTDPNLLAITGVPVLKPTPIKEVPEEQDLPPSPPPAPPPTPIPVTVVHGAMPPEDGGGGGGPPAPPPHGPARPPGPPGMAKNPANGQPAPVSGAGPV